ncbi:MAG TPA: hypothetical protein VM901_12725 [Bdellovibrionota bacterium]|nr:hypothetical protein [Bdellovibrionota bacterium]
MGARHDKSTPTKFHFGNALVELDHLIPRGDEVSFAPYRAEVIPHAEAESEMRLSAISAQLNELASLQSQLAFAIRDIKRSLK